MRMMLNQRDNGEDGKTENTQGRPDSSYSLQELLIFPQPMNKYFTTICKVNEEHQILSQYFDFVKVVKILLPSTVKGFPSSRFDIS